MVPSDSIPRHPLLAFIPLYSYFPCCNQDWSVWPIMYRSGGMWLLRLGHRRHCGFCLARSWWSCQRSQLPHCENPQAAHGRSPHGKKLRFAHSWGVRRTQVQLPSPVKPLRDYSLDDLLRATSWKTRNQKPQQSHSQIPDPWKLWNKCFKLLSFGLTCYLATDNWHKNI